jgi:hypothetical protein
MGGRQVRANLSQITSASIWRYPLPTTTNERQPLPIIRLGRPSQYLLLTMDRRTGVAGRGREAEGICVEPPSGA